MSQRLTQVAVVGAGFGGLFAAIEFERALRKVKGIEVTLIDRNNYHLFLPLLYHVATGGMEAGNICFAIRRILKESGAEKAEELHGPNAAFCRHPVLFREATVDRIDLEGQTVSTNRFVLKYDYLILALGSTTNFYNIPGLEEHVVPLKTITDGINMHNRILANFEEALTEDDVERRRRLLTFVIVGGGATGVELASTMAVFVYKTLARDFPTLMADTRIIMAEAGSTLLRGMRPEVARAALNRLRELGVDVRLNCQVASVSEEGITTKDGQQIASSNVTWVGGIKPTGIAERLGLPRARDGRIVVNEYLQVPTVRGLYVVGDLAAAMQAGTDRPYPPTAQTAVRMGILAARNILAEITNSPLRRFTYKYKGDLVFLGRGYAAGELWGRVVTGMPAFIAYQAYHLRTIMGFRNRLGTIIDWTYDYFYRRNTVKLT